MKRMRWPYGCIIIILALALCLTACNKKEAMNTTASLPPESSTPTIAPTATLPPTPTPPPPPTPAPPAFPTKGYCNGEGVNLRAQPSKSAEIVDIMGANTVLDIVSLQDGWYSVDLDGTTAYVAENLIVLGNPPRKDNMHWAKVSAKEAKMYKAPDGKDVSEVKLKKGEKLKVLRKIGDYLHVVYDKNLQRYILEKDVEYISQEEFKSQPAQ